MKIIKTGLVIVAVIAAMNVGVARADQPHMRRALEHLRAARAELAVAEENKGGWRERALANVDRAIADTERGMSFARGFR